MDDKKPNWKHIGIGIGIFAAILIAGFLWGIHKSHRYQQLPKELIIKATVKEKVFVPKEAPEPAQVFMFITEDGIQHTLTLPASITTNDGYKLVLMEQQTGRIGTVLCMFSCDSCTSVRCAPPASDEQMEKETQPYSLPNEGDSIDLVLRPNYDSGEMKLAAIRKSH